MLNCSWVHTPSCLYVLFFCQHWASLLLLLLLLSSSSSSLSPPPPPPLLFLAYFVFNPLNAKLNPICHLLALLGAHCILHISRIRVKFKGNIGSIICLTTTSFHWGVLRHCYGLTNKFVVMSTFICTVSCVKHSCTLWFFWNFFHKESFPVIPGFLSACIWQWGLVSASHMSHTDNMTFWSLHY